VVLIKVIVSEISGRPDYCVFQNKRFRLTLFPVAYLEIDQGVDI